MMLFTMWTTVLTIALQIQNSEPQPVKPGSLNSNFTPHPLEIGHIAKMPMTKPEATTYPVPGTTMTLEIASNPACVLSQDDVTKYLGNALRIAEDNDKSTLLEKVFRIEEPSIRFIFAISPPMYHIELTWGDVVSIVSSLLDYFKESGAWMEIKFEIGDKDRGELGTGTVGKLLLPME